MSLSGLDAQKVQDAHDVIVAHQGQWLLLHYVSRDELAILANGDGGLGALRDAVGAYDKQSPLYGYLNLQDKKLVLQYIPSGTSRLLQARTTVHLQLVLDRFSPHDAVLNATTLQDLDETPVHSLLKISPVGGYNDSATASMPLEADADNAPAPKQPEAQSANPDVMSILARLRAEKQETARPVESRRPSFSARSGRGVILDPYLSQLPQAQAQSIPRSASHRSKPSSEVGSLRSQPLASPRKFDDVDELEYMYALLKPKVKHAAKPATDEKIQKTMAASKVRQKLPAGMKIGSRSNSKEDTRVGKSHGRTNSAIEEWRNRNARSEGLAFTDNEELKLDAEEQKIIQEHRRANKQKRMSQMSQDIPTMETLQNDLDPSRPRYVEPVVRARKSQDLLRPAGPSTRPSYMSQGDRSDITPEKQRLMKALAMRKRQLGAGSRRTTDDTSVTLATQSAQAGRNLAETDVAGDKQDRRSTSQDWHSGSEEVKKHAEQDRTMEDLQLMAGSPRESEVAEHHDIVAANINRTPSQRTAQRLQVPQLDFLNPGRENGPLITDRRAEPAATDGHNASRYLAVGPSSPAKLQTPRLPSRRASHNTQGSGEDLEDGLSPSDSLMEELRLATVQEARMVATTSRSPEIFAREAPDMLPSPLGVPNAMTPSTTGEEVKASPVDSMLNGYPFPRTLDTVLEASSPEPSRKASTVKLNQHYFDARSPLAQETGGQRRAPTGGMPKNERRTSWLDVSQSSTHTTEEANFGTFLNLSRTTTGDSSVTSPMTPPVKNKSHNPRGNSRLPEIHPNARAEDTYAPPASEPDHDRTNTMSWGQRMLDSSPVKRTPSLSLFGRHRDRRAQSTTDLLHSDASPVKSSRSIRSGRDSTSSMSTITHHFGRHDTSGEQRRSSDVSRYFTGRKSSVGSLDPLGEEVAMKRGSGSWAMRTWKRYSASSRNSLTRLGEQCAEDGVTNTPLPVAKVPLAVREPKVPQPTASDTKSVSGPMVIGELNVQLPDSLLWKRRWAEINNGSYLILSPMSIQERAKFSPKRYHLSSFSKPMALGRDQEELPHSVVLELKDGGRIQLACEDAASQAQVLDWFLIAHRACAASGPL